MLRVLLAIFCFFTFAQARAATPFYEEQGLETVDFIENVFAARYAPREWKAKHLGWDLSSAAQAARQAIRQGGANLTLKQLQDVLRDLLGSVQDYHVDIYFHSTEKATLPLEIRSAEGRFFIAYIDQKKLTEAHFPFKVGDEVSQFNGRSVADERAEILKSIRPNVPESDLTFSEILLTRRSARMGLAVPRGPVEIEILREEEGKQVKFVHQLIWEYEEEVMNPSSRAPVGPHEPMQPKRHWLNRSMQLGSWKAIADLWQAADESPHQLGGKNSFVPELGTLIWENPKDKLFRAYIFRDAGALFGYVRIPSYMAEGEEPAEFLEVIKKMEEQTDALIIDQVNNPGGSVFYLYGLAAMLTDRPLATPKHRITITQADVQEAVKDLKKLDKVTNEEEAMKALGETVDGYPVSYEVAQFFRENARFVIEQWKAGARLTSPYFLGIDKIHPHPKGHYTKPILVLINESDYSGGDFFPAILQDNRRATLMGVRTAGAGGYVNEVEFPNLLGISAFTVTGSLAERVDKNPIENLGVKPDVNYTISVKDRQSNYETFKSKILEQLHLLSGN